MVRVTDVSFAYRVGDFRFHVRDLCVTAGEKVAIVGPSGCGKTTLLNLLAGILLPDGGRVEIAGVEVSALKRGDRQDFRALRMGLVFQEFELLEYVDVLGNVLLPYRVSPALQLWPEVRERAESLLQDVGLGDKRKRYPRSLSQGERQRVAVCRALVTQPAVLLGDEPTGNLDPENRDHVLDTMSRYAEDARAPLVIVTHDREVQGLFDRVVDIRELEQ
jgi:putative ABC transport system ATP-binding protein